MTRFTPGPWAYEVLPSNEEERSMPMADWTLMFIGPEDDERPGCVFRSFIEADYVTPDGNIEADARLVAAAPELYEALKAIVADEPWQNAPRDILRNARAVLAKANGDQP